MKTVEIREMTVADKSSVKTLDQYYRVRLGNGKICQFRSKRNADAFLVETSQFLTDQLVQVNRFYSQVFLEYRSVWFYLDGRTEATRKKMAATERRIQKDFDDIQKVFSKIHQSNYLRYNEWPFKMLGRALACIIAICDEMIEIRRTRKEFVERKAAEMLRSQCIICFRQILNYGHDQKFTYDPINSMASYHQKLKLRDKSLPFW